MTRTAIALLVAGVLIGGASAEQSSADVLSRMDQELAGASSVLAPGSCVGQGAETRPSYMRLVCVRDSHKGGSELHWRTWGATKAVATGRDGFSVECTGCAVVTWPARFTLTRPRLLRGDRLFTRLSIRATGSIPRGAAKYVDPVMRYEAKFRMTEGDSPCVWQWVDVQYADAGSWCPG